MDKPKKPRIKRLPKWCLTDKRPAFYDIESASAVGQTAKLYAFIQELTEDYNSFVDEVNSEIEIFEKDIETNQKCFKESIIEITENYVKTIDMKIAHQDRAIEELHVYVKENITTYLKDMMNQMKEAGELDQIILDTLEVLTTKFEELETEVNSILDSKIAEINALIETINGVKNEVDEMIANSVSYCETSKVKYETNDYSENIFSLPAGYTEKSLVFVYINGFKLNQDEYMVDSESREVELINSVDVAGTIIEIESIRLTKATEKDYEALKGDKGDPGSSYALSKNGNNIILTDDAGNENIVTLETATNESDGLLSKNDKEKIDSINNDVVSYDLTSYKTDVVESITRNICKVKNGVVYISCNLKLASDVEVGSSVALFENIPEELQQMSVYHDFVMVSGTFGCRARVQARNIYILTSEAITSGSQVSFGTSYLQE